MQIKQITQSLAIYSELEVRLVIVRMLISFTVDTRHAAFQRNKLWTDRNVSDNSVRWYNKSVALFPFRLLFLVVCLVVNKYI